MSQLVIINNHNNNPFPNRNSFSERASAKPILLVGFQNQGNLGIGYLAATLMRYGYSVRVLDFQKDREQLLEAVLADDPILIGFSLIFQFYLPRFRSLMQYLRDRGVSCHFTIGGHFPSLSYQRTLELIPEVDSVVRFEGELTLLELVNCLTEGREWRTISGISYREEGSVTATPLRHMLDDLDLLPYPDRPYQPKEVLGKKAMPILASRGCSRTCSFCSIHMFYRASPGRIVRIRKAEQVVREMKSLNQERDISIFLFQDDDFPLFGPSWRRWALSFVDELNRQGLVGKVIWKISCRADVVERELFSTLRDAGLYLVYMGLESGTEEGLDLLNKEITVEQNLKAVSILKSLDLKWEFGFMLFDPSSTFESIKENVKFLRQIVGDGSVAATFCKMLPYDGTPIKDELIKAGRFNGDVCNPDYEFLEPRLDRYYETLGRAISGWVNGPESLSAQFNHAWHEVYVLERFFPEMDDVTEYKEELRSLTQSSNDLLFSVVEELGALFERDSGEIITPPSLEPTCRQILSTLLKNRDAFIFRNQGKLLEALYDSSFIK